MEIRFYRHRNLLMEVLFAPHLMLESSALLNEQNLSHVQINSVEDILASTKRLSELSKSLKPDFDECMLSHGARYLSLSYYFYLLSQGHDPHTPEELFELFAHMSEDELRASMRNCLEIDNDNFLAAIHKIEDMEPQIRWYWLSATASPVEHMQKMLTLLRKTTPLYLREREQYESEYQKSVQKIEQFSLDDILSRVVTIDKLTQKEIIEDKGILDVYVLSSPFLLFMLIVRENLNDPEPHAAFITPRIEEVLNMSNTEIDENAKNILKILSDPTSYRILQLLTTTNLKAKDIAESLKITSAAVSYHTQKLILHKLITFNPSRNEKKYSLNKALLRQVFQFVAEDLGIDR